MSQLSVPNVKANPFNMEIKKIKNMSENLFNIHNYEVEYSGGNKEKRKVKLSYGIIEPLKPYLMAFHYTSTPDKPSITTEDLHKLKKYIIQNTDISKPVKYKNSVEQSVDSTARLDFLNLLDIGTDEGSEGGKDITPNEQVEIIDQFLKWYNKELPWSSSK